MIYWLIIKTNGNPRRRRHRHRPHRRYVFTSKSNARHTHITRIYESRMQATVQAMHTNR